MIHDDIWLAIARADELLCMACVRERVRLRLGRDLAFADLLPCAFNVWNRAFEELAPDELKWGDEVPRAEAAE